MAISDVVTGHSEDRLGLDLLIPEVFSSLNDSYDSVKEPFTRQRIFCSITHYIALQKLGVKDHCLGYKWN